MTKAAAIFDIDGTLLPGTSMDRIFLVYLIKKGVVHVGDLLRMVWFCIQHVHRGKEYIIKKNKAYLQGKDPVVIETLARQCFKEEIIPRILPAVRKLIQEHKEKGDLIVFLSAALEPLVALWNFELEGDIAIGTKIGVKGGKLTGTIEGIHSYEAGKVFYIDQLLQEHHIDLTASYGYGDHLSDNLFLSKVGHPVVVHPSKAMRQYAQQQGWLVIKEL